MPTSLFAPAVNYAVGSGPASVAIGDLNGDDLPDLAVTNRSSGTVSVLLGNANGSFQTQSTYAVGPGPNSVAMGDMNGDGLPDLAVTNRNSGTVSVLLGNADGTFQTQSAYNVGNDPSSVAMGDMNGDGFTDLAVANDGSDTVSILLGNANGTFLTQSYVVGDRPGSIAIGDLDGDGRPDLAVTNRNNGTVSVLLGNTGGSFQTQSTYAVGSNPGAVAMGDMNGDGRPDLAVANWNSGTVSVLLDNPDGTFQTQSTFATGEYPSSVAIGDLNGDGRPDLAVTNGNGGTVSVLVGNADGTFQTQSTYAVGSNPGPVAIGDLNGDGRPDLAVANWSDGTVSVLLGSGYAIPVPVQKAVSYALSAAEISLILTGTANINGTGNSLANTLTGNSGNNILNGGVGADAMAGGLGNDTYVVDNARDVVTESASAGVDLVQSSITYTLTANVEKLYLTGTAAIDGTGNSLDNRLYGNTGKNTLTGGAGNDTYFIYNTTAVVVEGASAGMDVINSTVTYTLPNNVEYLGLTGTAAINGTGNSSDNRLYGNTGINTLTGGTGNDTYYIYNAGAVVVEGASGGTMDIVYSSVTYALAANVERLYLTSTAAINGTGNSLDNSLYGNTGINTLTGGAGNDTYFINNTGAVVVEGASGGAVDTVYSSVTYTLAANVENLTLTGTTAINGTGNTQANILTGNSGRNTLTGGAGNDTYFIYNTTAVVVEGASAGMDVINSTVTYTLPNNVENLGLTGTAAINGTGNSLDNRLYGNTGINTLTGGAGNDIYYIYNTGAVVVEDASGGTVDIVYSSVSYTLAANVERLYLTSTAAINGTGNSLNNVLIGNSGGNTLTGKAGSDILTGGGGADTFYFTASDDGGDTITDFDAGDTLRFSSPNFGGLPVGALAANRFVSNTTGTASTADQRFIFNTATGQLRYDADGSGSGAAATTIATLTGVSSLSANQITLVTG